MSLTSPIYLILFLLAVLLKTYLKCSWICLALILMRCYFLLSLPSLCSQQCLNSRPCFSLGPGKEFDMHLIFLLSQFEHCTLLVFVSPLVLEVLRA